MAKAKGRIKIWNNERGTGWIANDAGGENVFLHHSEVPSKDREFLTKGALVEFDIQNSDHAPGRLDAYNFRLSEPPSPVSQSEPATHFHNPYTFVPTPPRPSSGFAGDFNPLEHGLDHASLKDNLWTGHIPIKLTTVTPVVLLKGDGRKEDSTEPYDVYDRLPESSLRGMFRSAYEVVTNSRFGCFRNDEQLAYRMDTREAVKLIPAIIKKDKTSKKLKVCLSTGTTHPQPDGPKKPRSKKYPKATAKKCAMYAAMLTWYKNRTPKTDLQGHYNKPKTGDKVYAEIILCEKPRYLYWKASRVWRKEDCSTKPTRGNVPKTWKNVSLCKDSNGKPVIEVVEGTVLVTNENIDRKHDERIFFCDNPKTQQKVDLTDDHKKVWEKLIKNYRDAHPDDDIFNRKDMNGTPKKPWQVFKKNPDTLEYAWSPHLYHRKKKKDRWGRETHDALDLQDGDMVYARCDIDDKTGTINAVKDLFPVMISRELYENSPKDLLDESLQPANNLDDLSPADRLFGWTPQRQGSDGGYKSRIRVVCENDECPTILKSFENDPLPLTILGQPKPEQGRFYVAANDKGTPQNKAHDKKDAGYDKKGNKQLRGRKHYWHHKGFEADKENPNPYWDPFQDQNQEYIRTGRVEDTQNRSINGWIEPGNEFEATLYLQNLQCDEVGALLWLLTLNDNLDKGDDKHYFKLGYGKPLGFGSVKVEIDTVRLKNGCLPIGTGEDWKTYYAKFDACPPTKSKAKQDNCLKIFMDSMLDAYKSLNQQNFKDLPFIKGFLRVLQGPIKDVPIHYPRLPDPNSKNFEWFMANERGRSRKNEVGLRLALPDVNNENDEGLPYIPSKPRN